MPLQQHLAMAQIIPGVSRAPTFGLYQRIPQQQEHQLIPQQQEHQLIPQEQEHQLIPQQQEHQIQETQPEKRWCHIGTAEPRVMMKSNRIATNEQSYSSQDEIIEELNDRGQGDHPGCRLQFNIQGGVLR